MGKEKSPSNLSRRDFISRATIAATGITLVPVSFFSCQSARTPSAAAAPPPLASTSLLNPTPRDSRQETLRLQVLAPGAAGSFVVKQDGAEVPYQVELIDGKPYIWVCADFAPGARRHYELSAGKPQVFPPRVTVKRQGEHYLLDNGQVQLLVPAAAGSGIPGPIAGLKLPDGTQVGGSVWHTRRKLRHFTATIVGEGTILGKVRLRYEFDGLAGAGRDLPAFAEVDISLAPGWAHAAIAERHEMGPADSWEFVASQGWAPTSGISRQFNNGPGGDGKFVVPPMDRPLVPITNVSFAPDLYINLIPRWNQHFKDGWAFAATDGRRHVSAVVVRASQWQWPHDNGLACVVKPGGGYAGIRASTWRGRRLWWLAPGLTPVDADYVRRHAWEHLDKVNHDYVLEWPGQQTSWWSLNAYDSGQMNPTAKVRSIGKAAMKQAGGPAQPDTLIRFQTLMHPDAYGSYWDYWSPENPNFFTDFNIVPWALATNLKAHPRFEAFRRAAELRFREDLYHSITMPSGAGQECPGYSHYAQGHWQEIARMGEKHLGFDMDFIRSRTGAAARFYRRITFPDGALRRGSPMGDSHPDRKGGGGMAPVAVPAEEVQGWQTEELQGFGVAFTNRPGTDRETYLAFKSGPNRGHYHGDQLAFHYCANARPLVVDHPGSYHPRAGPGHKHNRLAFFTDQMPYANMDGYEHVLAFKTSADVDIAVGQVESQRLRQVEPTPPEAWDARYPQIRFDEPLIYRRTVVLMKNGPQDYFVFRDQYWADRPLNAAYCLHTYGHEPVQKGQVLDFGKLTLFCATPKKFRKKNFNWQHDNGGLEQTKGLRLEMSGQTGEFITVMYPGNKPPVMKAVPGGVQVGKDVVTFAGSQPSYGEAATLVRVSRAGRQLQTLAGTDVDFNRHQGQVGLFVPDAGYVFGDIPDWLARQRAARPDWAKS